MTVVSSGRPARVLDPIERLSEVIFGLIMVLTFTGPITAATELGEVREVLIGAIGCNLAWGIVDAAMYLVTILVERGRGLAIARAVRAAPDPERGRRLIAENLPEPLNALFEGGALENARAKVAALPEVSASPKLRSGDWLAALAVFLLVFLSTFPVVLPFVFLQSLTTASRVSEGIAIVMLYASGHILAAHAGLRKLRTGLAMVAIGVLLVGLTVALGG